MIIQAKPEDLQTVSDIVQTTIAEVYPHYYPAGAVQFFQEHHSRAHIEKDLADGAVYLLYDGEFPLATLTINDNEINRLFVLPEQQGRGHGTKLMEFAEAKIAAQYPEAVLCSSFAAQELYMKRGYTVDRYWKIPCENGDFLCYYTMKKTLSR